MGHLLYLHVIFIYVSLIIRVSLFIHLHIWSSIRLFMFTRSMSITKSILIIISKRFSFKVISQIFFHVSKFVVCKESTIKLSSLISRLLKLIRCLIDLIWCLNRFVLHVMFLCDLWLLWWFTFKVVNPCHFSYGTLCHDLLIKFLYACIQIG